MERTRKLCLLLLALMLCASLIAIPICAASAEQNGLELTLTTNKDVYGASEDIVADLTLKNAGNDSVENVVFALEELPGYNYADVGGAQCDVIAAGEVASVQVTLVPEVTEPEETEPETTEPETTEQETTPSVTQPQTPGNETGGNPSTGDSSSIGILIAIAGVSFAAIVVLLITDKNGKKHAKMMISVLMVGALLTGMAVPAAADTNEPEYESFEVTTEITVDGAAVALTAYVVYQVEEEPVPTRTYTRGEWIQLLIDACGYPTEFEGVQDVYTDIEDSQYRAYIEAAVIYGLLMPGTDEAFDEDAPATREFAAVTAVRCLGYSMDAQIECEDAEDVSCPAEVAIALECGMLNLEDGYFYPNRTLNDLEANQILAAIEAGFATLDDEEQIEGFDFLDGVIVKDCEPWTGEGNTMIIPAGEEIPQVGDLIVFGYEKAIRVESVEQVDGNTVITYSTPELYEFLDYVNIGGQAVADFSSFVPAEGVTVEVNTAQRMPTRGFMDDMFDVPADTIGIDGTIELSGDIDLGDGWEFGYELSIAIPTAGYKFDVDFGNPFFGETPVNVKNAYVKLEENIGVHVDIGNGFDSSDEEYDDSVFDDILEKEIPLGSVPLVGIPGLGVEIEFDLVFTAEGRFEVDYNVYGTLGVQVLNNRVKNISALQSSFSAGIAAEITAGPEIGLEVEMFNKDLFSFSAGAGVGAIGSVHVRSTGLVCVDATAYVYLNISAMEKTLIDDWLDIAVGFDIWDSEKSPFKIKAHWENLIRVDECTYTQGTIKGTVASADDRTQYIENAKIDIYEHTELEHKKTVYSNANGAYTAVVPGDTYLVRISADGYIPFESLETVGDGQLVYLETYLLVAGEEDSDETGVIGGKITNAVTGYSIPNVQLVVREGWNMHSGEIVDTGTTDSSGYYTMELPLGNYTISMECEGYIAGSINVAVTASGNNNCHGVLNPDGSSAIELGDMRIVLTWGATPSDLDSHLRGPSSDGESRYHIYYSDMSYYENGDRISFLDVDDISSYGPETTTVYNMLPNGTYSFYVHDYTNRNRTGSTVMANSGANVKVYMGEELIANYHIPTEGIGNVWHVFDFNAVTGELIAVNEFSTNSNPSSVGSSIPVRGVEIAEEKKPAA